jgi:hypothetical protein
VTGLPDVQPRLALSWWQPWLALGLFYFTQALAAS